MFVNFETDLTLLDFFPFSENTMGLFIVLPANDLIFLSAVFCQNGRSYHGVCMPTMPYPYDSALSEKTDEKEWAANTKKNWNDFMLYYRRNLEPSIERASKILSNCRLGSEYERREISFIYFNFIRIHYWIRRKPCPYIPLDLLLDCEKALQNYIEQIQAIDSSEKIITIREKSDVRCGLTFLGGDLIFYTHNRMIHRLMWELEYFMQPPFEMTKRHYYSLTEVIETIKEHNYDSTSR